MPEDKPSLKPLITNYAFTLSYLAVVVSVPCMSEELVEQELKCYHQR